MKGELIVVPLTLRTVHPEVTATVDSVIFPASFFIDGATEPNVRIGPLVARAFIAAGGDGPPCLVFLLPVPDVEMGQTIFDLMTAAHLAVSAIENGEDWTEEQG